MKKHMAVPLNGIVLAAALAAGIYFSFASAWGFTGIRIPSYDAATSSVVYRAFQSRAVIVDSGIRIELSNGVSVERAQSQPVWIVGEGWKRWSESPSSFAPGRHVLYREGGSARPVAIASLSRTGVGEYRTYVNVEGTHCYFYRGVLVHNCTVDYGVPGSPIQDCHSSGCPSSCDYIPPPPIDDHDGSDGSGGSGGNGGGSGGGSGGSGGGGGSSTPSPCSTCHNTSCTCAETRKQSADTVAENEANAADAAAGAEQKGNEEKKAAESTALANGSRAAGDPVLTSSGIYVMSEEDLAVTRTYRSGSAAPGLPAGGWFYSTDSRLLRGFDHAAIEVAALLQGYQENLNAAAETFWRYNGSEYSQEGIDILAAQASINALCDAWASRSDRAETLAALNGRFPLRGIAENLLHTGNDTLVWVDPSGSPVVFIPEPGETGRWIPANAASKGIVIDSTDGKDAAEATGFTLTGRNGVVRSFDQWGLPVAVTELRGERESYARDEGTGRVVSVSDAHGAVWNLEYADDGALSALAGPLGQSVSYAYDTAGGNGLLASVTDSDGDTVRFGYDTSGRLVAVTKPDSLAPQDSVVEISYGAENSGGPLVTATCHEEGGTETFAYYPAENRTRYANQCEIVTDYYYDESHRPVKEVAPDGMVTEYAYAGASSAPSAVYRYHTSGSRPSVPWVRYTYDAARNNPIKAVYADQSYEEWSWNGLDQMTSYRDRDGAVTKQTFDAYGNLTMRGMVANGTLTKTYEAGYDAPRGRLLWERAANRVKWTYSYDTDTGYPSSRNATVNGETLTEYWAYDIVGRLVSSTDGEGRVTSYAYRPKTVTEDGTVLRSLEVAAPGGLRRTLYYNDRKDPVTVVEEDVKTGKTRTTAIAYDRRHLPVRVTDAAGNVTEYAYRADGLLARETRGPWSTLYEYHPVTGEAQSVTLRKVIGADGEGNPVYARSLVSYSSSRDGSGNLVRTVTSPNPAGIEAVATVSSVYSYDSFDRLVAVKNAAGEVSSRGFSPAGRLRSEQTASGGWLGYSYDSAGYPSKAGRVASSGFSAIPDPVTVYHNADGSINRRTDREGLTVYREYDGLGRLRREYSAAGEKTFAYDKAGRLIRQGVKTLAQKPLLAAAPSGSAETYTVWAYEDTKRTVTVSEGGLYETVWTLDAWGNPVKKADSRGNAAEIAYDGLGRPSEERDPYGRSTRYSWNALGKLARIDRPDASFETYEYDERGNLTEARDALGVRWKGSYNPAGLLAEESGRPGIDKAYAYDTLGRLISVKTGGVVTERYEYENRGTIIRYSSGSAEKYSYAKNAYGELVSETNRLNKKKDYGYDDEGSPVSETAFSGAKFATRSDPLTLTAVSSRNGVVHSAVVADYSGRIVSASSESGTIRFSYDAGGRMVKQVDEGAGETTAWEYDADGRRTRMKSGNRDVRYAYGKAGELLSVFDTGTRLSVSFAYDSLFRETERRFGNGVIQKTARDPVGRVSMIREYSAGGELLRGEGYLYDESGRRSHAVTESGAVTRYEYDGQSRLSSVSYPATEALVETARLEALDSGLSLPTGSPVAAARYFDAKEYATLRALLDSMGPLRSNALKPSAPAWTEVYTYDERGNRASKATPWGVIRYEYDAENRMTKAGAVVYAYNDDGYLVMESGLRKSATYTYNAFNRMESSTVTDRESKSQTVSRYGYDALNRRTLLRDSGGTLRRTLYDGLSFDVLREASAFDDGSFTRMGRPAVGGGDGLSSTGRYVWIDERGQDARTVVTPSPSSDRYAGERTPLYASGYAVGTALESTATIRGGPAYFGTDLLGSVRSATDAYGTAAFSCEYDAFGTPLLGDFSSGISAAYTGKPYDPVTGLYDYGYRDYAPTQARFTTPDPIRDGRNWFSYVNNDPVNWVDPWGLIANSITSAFKMNDTDWKDNQINNVQGSQNTLGKQGCAIDLVANISTTANGTNTTPQDLNSKTSTFSTKGSIDISWSGAGNNAGLEIERSAQYSYSSLNKAAAQYKLDKAIVSPEKVYIGVQVPITVKGKVESHWVGVDGQPVVDYDGTTYLKVSATSINDNSGRTVNPNWKYDATTDSLYVRKDSVTGTIIARKKDDPNPLKNK